MYRENIVFLLLIFARCTIDTKILYRKVNNNKKNERKKVQRLFPYVE